MFKQLKIKSKIKPEYTVDFIDNLKQHLEQNLDNSAQVFVIDSRVAQLFEADFKDVLARNRFITVESNENHKEYNYIADVINMLLSVNVRKNDTLIAIGGGVIQDIVAFISSVLFRGIDWKFYPTTLLAQCDSCIGSKSSINFGSYKNLVGTFNPPTNIYIYQKFVNTLPITEIKSGIGEMLHYFFSEGWNLAESIRDNYDEILIHREKLLYYINNSLRIKKQIIEIDEFDMSIRHIFNYGHTFGHAIEAITGYKICHGQAISIGMDISNYLSLHYKMISNDEFIKMHNILSKNLPAFTLNDGNIEAYLNALTKDKKNIGSQLGCILTRGPGHLEKVFLDFDLQLKKLLLDYSKNLIIL